MPRFLLAALLLLGTVAHGEATAFLGHWENPDSKATGLTHVVISPSGGDKVEVRAYGDCHPSECNWGLVAGRIYSRDPKSSAVDTIIAVFHYGFAERQVVFRRGPAGRLRFEMLTSFSDASDRHDFVANGELRPSVWAGPIAQNWERPAGLSTGWGGGARNGVSPPPAESCAGFDSAKLRTTQKDGLWKVTAAGKTLLEAGHDEKNALLVEVVIRHYRFDRRCTVGGPWKTYWKAGNGFPHDRMDGIACLAFNPATTHLVLIGGDWKIVDGPAEIAVLGANKAKAEAMLALIRHHRLTQECFVRRGDPLMTFWLKD
jgi:hypothetical protein